MSASRSKPQLPKPNPKPPQHPVSSVWSAEDYVTESVPIEEVREIKQAFDIFDADKSGFVDPQELKAAFVSLGFAANNKSIYRIISDLDTSHQGGLNFANFLKLSTNKLGKNISLKQVETVFKSFDQDGNVPGKIDAQQFRQVANQLGENLTEEQIEKIFFKTDFDGDGYITPEDFYEVLISRSAY